MSLKSASRLPLYLDSDLYFILPQYFIDQFRYARSLEKGVILGQDPEFNHQYRVALRRIRSLCVLLEELLSPFERKLIKPNLKMLMKRTNLLRDLDVFLINQPSYLAILPEQDTSLENIFSVIKSRQVEEQKNVANWLQSSKYIKATVMIQNSLFRALQYERRSKPMSPLPYANNKILTQFRKVTKSIKPVTNSSEDRVIHALRIKCKSLRYLLESFSALYSSEQHKQNVKHLKFLQDQLGDFNDTSTQIDFFTHLRKEAAVAKSDRKTLKAVISEIEDKHEHSRQTVLSHVNQFEQFIKESSALEVYRA
ncbi:CHAD domain-containing protein [Vibrio sp. B1FLJ16]|uniref:CHAD domain-containing protein n=1 Tax=Vibrio sp. B1FLJ16 TaxID=2751178 RepID=UPI0015F619FD|nr:CHAD domain-containing protein [Vibrio sp. B1FLJ16]CAD7819750.1 hypothetical protein ACOMICROBIO_EPCKBFOG_03712 [Vibrio sp. B1FLJ16]CAE6940392.1 hypothetical protein ACOMICROBIO_EPCKBFOG_03712 [Vibrio sp. B1FLJ16]